MPDVVQGELVEGCVTDVGVGGEQMERNFLVLTDQWRRNNH